MTSTAITPTHIDVSSEDEIGELAQAFNDVETVTLEVAQQQSVLLQKGMGDLFVNLARRNQSLLERQLELLDELERNEHDPSALDALFKLDHMATRMRRNAESLLVLSGAEQPRQWHEVIGLLDVVRSAAAEIADFPRVELVGIDDRISVSGRAVSDVSHLLAELLENATAFSSPDTAVVVSGAITKSGLVLAITDQGIGITTDRIDEANTLLRNPPVVGLALSRARWVCTSSARWPSVTASRWSCARATPTAPSRWWRCRSRSSKPAPTMRPRRRWRRCTHPTSTTSAPPRRSVSAAQDRGRRRRPREPTLTAAEASVPAPPVPPTPPVAPVTPGTDGASTGTRWTSRPSSSGGARPSRPSRRPPARSPAPRRSPTRRSPTRRSSTRRSSRTRSSRTTRCRPACRAATSATPRPPPTGRRSTRPTRCARTGCTSC